jgi:hypothetical protein
MNEIIAYKCDHCGKIHKRKAYVKQHEKKCYHNPKTRSCASCRFLIFGYQENHDTGFHEPFQSCLRGQDIKYKQLKTNCEEHDAQPEDGDEIEYIHIFQGPIYLKTVQ